MLFRLEEFPDHAGFLHCLLHPGQHHPLVEVPQVLQVTQHTPDAGRGGGVKSGGGVKRGGGVKSGGGDIRRYNVVMKKKKKSNWKSL